MDRRISELMKKLKQEEDRNIAESDHEDCNDIIDRDLQINTTCSRLHAVHRVHRKKLKRIKIENQLCTIENIYGQNNNDGPEFFKQSVGEHMLDLNGDDIILAEDFSLVLEVEKDKQVGNSTTQTMPCKNSTKLSKIQISEIIYFNWRDLNPEIKRFSWSRLDFFLISNCLYPNVVKTEINSVY